MESVYDLPPSSAPSSQNDFMDTQPSCSKAKGEFEQGNGIDSGRMVSFSIRAEKSSEIHCEKLPKSFHINEGNIVHFVSMICIALGQNETIRREMVDKPDELISLVKEYETKYPKLRGEVENLDDLLQGSRNELATLLTALEQNPHSIKKLKYQDLSKLHALFQSFSDESLNEEIEQVLEGVRNNLKAISGYWNFKNFW